MSGLTSFSWQYIRHCGIGFLGSIGSPPKAGGYAEAGATEREKQTSLQPRGEAEETRHINRPPDFQVSKVFSLQLRGFVLRR